MAIQQELTQDLLKSIVSYDPETGVFKWLIKPSMGVNVNDKAGSLGLSRGKTYIKIRFKGKNYQAHRLAWLYMYGEFPIDVMDHIDGNGTNNKINNLRSVTRRENSRNCRKYASNSSGITGVVWHKASSKWSANIRIKGKDIYLGVFESISDASNARKNASLNYQFHSNHGSDRPL